MLKRLVLAVIVLVIAAAAAAAAYWWAWPREQTQAAERPDIPFAPLVDERLKDPDNPTKVFRVDFARIEHNVPLSRSDPASCGPPRRSSPSSSAPWPSPPLASAAVPASACSTTG